jgi:glycosyltransferase involved in cell wall biosynthesis
MVQSARFRFSIVTPSYNQARFIRRTIESVLGQEGEFDLEYLVVDGGSSDGTAAILEEYGPRLQWISEPDRGQVDAINKGLERTTGDIVGWLNSDDMLLPGALRRAAEVFTARPEVEWVHGRCRIIDEQDRVIRGWVEAYKHIRAKRHTLETLLVENYVNQMTVFWRRSLLEAVGILDPQFSLAFDYELWLRFAQRGAPAYIDQPQACFRWYEASKSGANFEAQLRENSLAAEKYAAGRRSLVWRNRVTGTAIAAVYRAMALARKTRSRRSATN